MSAKHMASGSSRPSYHPKGDSPYSASHSRSAGSVGNASQGASPYTQPYQPTASRYSGDAVSYVKSRKGAGAPGKPVRRGPRWWQILLIVLAVLVVVGGTCGFFMYEDLKAIKSEAQNAKQELAVYKDALMNGKSDELSSSAASLAQSTQTMADCLSSPLWTAAEIVPVYGQDVRQGRELVGVANDFMHNGLLPFSNDLNGVSIKSLVKDGGQVDIPILQKVVNAVLAIKVPLTDTIHKIQSLEPFHIQKINDVLEGAQSMLSQASDLLDEADDVLPQLPVMLGADGQTKTYLLLALNNVESQAAGGFPGAWGTMTVTDGKIALGDSFVPFGQERPEGGTGVDLTDEEANAFNMAGAKISPAVTLATPQFPRAASMASQVWLNLTRQAVNGVVAVDPVFLQALLAVTGQSVDVQGIHVDGSSAATVLMHDTYWNLPVEAQDAFFAGVAGASFKAVFQGIGQADSGDLAKTIMDGALTRNFQVWMVDEAQEAAIDALGFSGKLEDDPAKPVLGTYTTDYTWSKIDWYLNMNTQVGEGVKNADGSVSYPVTTTVNNAMTLEEAANAPEYVTGYNSSLKRGRGDMVTGLYLVAPAGGTITNLQATGGEFTSIQASAYGFEVWQCQLNDLPQETTTITYTVTTSPEATQPLRVSRTPAARSFS